LFCGSDSISDLLPNSSPTANARDNGFAWTRVAEVASVFTQELSKVWATGLIPAGITVDTEGTTHNARGIIV
jgi:hypothetical protein